MSGRQDDDGEEPVFMVDVRVRRSHVLIPQAGPRLFFQRVPEGKVVKNRVHLCVRVGTGRVGEERLAALEAECA
ncbi:hypothetical protein OG417_07960 [Actinoallomurus sp. NBC_01490]|jgi:hypothetical protein|uniref:VOC family protein n=1 Tax=Actinoallomurus sp. NBC_01490 TaxID=2903557 RepID=UPI002E37290D|nr:VOC family protein [Actinoallomurus sp. NBC_01490]